MKLAISLLLPVHFLWSEANIPSVEERYPQEYKDAKAFVTLHRSALTRCSKKTHKSNAFAAAVVFPELMRYSLVKDYFETEALSIAYIKAGSNEVDFSIGPFQMKPSFAEHIENQVLQDEQLKSKFYFLRYDLKLNERGVRNERIKRLQSVNKCIEYLEAFIAICDKRFASIAFVDEIEKVSFYSNAYNAGFLKSLSYLQAIKTQRNFPYGVNFKGEQYAYAEVAAYFFKNHSSLLN
ncbi:MAG: hypothetical protein ACK5CY_06000 [Bacteroidia bacterium]|jgi:hypothetical protein